jgi:hypothetical protein
MLAIPYDQMVALSAGAIDPSSASIGSIVYVEMDQKGAPIRILLTPTRDSVAHNITANVPWAITLRAEAQIDERLQQLAEELLSQYVDASDIRNVFRNAARGVPLTLLHTTDAATPGPVGVIRSVINRLELWSRLRDPNVNNGLWPFHGGLREYLLLTCFDLLGQDPHWMPFSQWLDDNSDKVSSERANALQERPTDGLQAARALNACYNKIYGVRRSFDNFINSVLPDQQRVRLLDSIHLSYTPLKRDQRSVAWPADEKAKVQFLFDMRNAFTHHGASMTFLEPHPQDAPRSPDPVTVYAMGTRVEHNRRVDWGVRNWPYELERSVASGLVAYVRKLASP